VIRYANMQKLMEAIDAPLPESTVGTDNDGQIIIYTGLFENDFQQIEVMPEDDESDDGSGNDTGIG
jgi:hypothetical protein